MNLVTVYIPTKNRLSLLKRSVDSVLAQTHKNIELIIVDDGSSDGTPEYLHQLANENSNVRFFSNEKSEGACVARNRAIVAAQGEFVAGLDDDDEFTEDRIETMLDAYDDKYSFLTSSQWWDYGKRRTLLGGKQKEISFSDQLFLNDATSQIFVKKQRIIDAGLFDIDFPSCQDWEMWTRLTKMYGTALKIAAPTYIIHAGHAEPRISLSSNRIKGFELFFHKYSRYMTDEHLVSFKLKLIENKKEKLSFSNGIKYITLQNYKIVVKLWLISYLPILQRIKKGFMSGK